LSTYSARNDLLLGHSSGNHGAGSDTAARPNSDQRKGTKPPENLPAGRRPPERDSALTLCFFSRTFDRGVISSIFRSRASVAPTIPLAWEPKNIGRLRLFLAKSPAESTSQHSTFASELAPIGGPPQEIRPDSVGPSSPSTQGIRRVTSVSLWYRGFEPFTRKIAKMPNSLRAPGCLRRRQASLPLWDVNSHFPQSNYGKFDSF
jgi:hypothetical protein